MNDTKSYDVIVVGGGPAGACAATLVAEKGHRVLLLERAREPQFKLGESLMPATYWTLERLGLLDRLKASGFPNKLSVQFFSSNGKASAPFYFFESDDHESSRTWQVLRSEFDELLLENAREKGVDVRRGSPVKEVLFEGERAVGVRAELDGQGNLEVASRVVVDASGQSALIGRSLALKESDPCLQNVSYYTHFEGAVRDSGIDAGATLILSTEDRRSWFWYIPLPEDRVSVGVVGLVDHLVRNRTADPQTVFEEELARCPALRPRLEPARQIRPVQAIRDFSYRCRRIAGDGWVLVGDAFGFLDPIYSSGVFLALKSGEFAADAINAGLECNDLSAAQLGSFGDEYVAGMEAIRKLIYAFYDSDFSFADFLKRHGECRLDLIDLLVGNVFRKSVDGLFGPLSEMSRLPEAKPLAGSTSGE